MIRFALRQARTQIFVAAAALAAVVAVTLATGPGLAHLYSTTIVPCSSQPDGCSSTTRSLFLQHDQLLDNILGLLVAVLPAVLAMFWGAPLVAREMEAGTPCCSPAP